MNNNKLWFDVDKKAHGDVSRDGMWEHSENEGFPKPEERSMKPPRPTLTHIQREGAAASYSSGGRFTHILPETVDHTYSRKTHWKADSWSKSGQKFHISIKQAILTHRNRSGGPIHGVSQARILSFP